MSAYIICNVKFKSFDSNAQLTWRQSLIILITEGQNLYAILAVTKIKNFNTITENILIYFHLSVLNKTAFRTDVLKYTNSFLT